MDTARFAELSAQGFNRIPVCREVFADLDTPLSAYLKLARGAYSYLFESVHGGEKWGRYSIIGLPARDVLKVFGHDVRLYRDGVMAEEHLNVADPLQFVEQFQTRFRVPEIDGLPAFNGGLVGYFGYDTIRYVEKRLAHSCPPDMLGVPDILLMVSEDVLVFDNLAGTLKLITHANPAEPDALAHAEAVVKGLQLQRQSLQEQLHHATPQQKPAFIDMIAKIAEVDLPAAEAEVLAAKAALEACEANFPHGPLDSPVIMG